MLKKLKRLWLSEMKKAASAQRKRVDTMLKVFRAKPSAPAKTERRSASSSDASKPIGAWVSGHHRHGPGLTQRSYYRLFLPYRPEAAMPLVVMLHGCQQTAAEFAQGTDMNVHAAKRGCAVLYPEQPLRAHPQRCWKWYDKTTQKGGGDVATLAALIEDVVSSHAIDRQRIYVCGISAGAAMAHILALTHPSLVAAVGLHSGPVFGACNSAAGAYRVMQHGSRHPEVAMDELLVRLPRTQTMPAILIGGDIDKTVRPVNQRQLAEQFVSLNRTLALTAMPTKERRFGRASRNAPMQRRFTINDHTIGRKVMIRSVMIEGLGHAWSGGDDAMSFNARGPDASRLMLNFLERHRRY
ncbi:extracellular catalytic domain type 1 short-chain-length polyhydroxyalkanoate depolymerase [Herbaspirillum seropedicae]|uniref:extracellular catalytic domain type 1 short-chain-length polyhydroxyalkanoate depolymerase n=1 Tax=Herbaspirillum seropedicae TaxID=964 RepID=UPI002859EC83|nr:PHB depolymerase family esterase [Herbaspirillum seropedicae]MDR6395191.1 poly(hydroxyalkanoate) depolymerase family esterase [Herbaspirillum seropedicae]